MEDFITPNVFDFGGSKYFTPGREVPSTSTGGFTALATF